MNAMHRPTARGRLFSIFASCICIPGLTAPGLAADASPAARRPQPALADAAARLDKLTQDVNLAMGITRSELITIEPGWGVEQPFEAAVAVRGVEYLLDLVPVSNRTQHYQLLVDDGSGTLQEQEPGPVNTYRGIAWGAPGSVVAAALLGDRLHAMIDFADGSRFWIEPVADRVPGLAPDTYVVYDDADSLGANGHCGLNDQGIAAMQAPAGFGAPGDEEAGGGGGGAATGGPSVDVAELGIDADYDYYQDYGSSVTAVENRVNSVINTVNVQYQNEVDITHEITAIIVRTSPLYVNTGAGSLLGEFRNYWLAHHAAIPRDVVQLFTGKELNGSTIGIAWGIGEICTNGAFCLVQSDCCGSLGCATDLSAHELGHLWGAFHCDPCNTTMRSYIGCFNNFGSATNASIIAHRDSRTCLNSQPVVGYCAAVSANPGTDYVARVQVGEIDNATGGSTYSDFTQLSTGLLPGEPVQITITPGLAGGSTIGGVWIDWTQDNDFSDLFETIQNNFSGVGPYTATINVPEFAQFGQTRMRVRVLDGASDPFPLACGVSNFGEVEDYTIIIQDIPPPTNDNCESAPFITEGLTPFTTIGATTDGPVEPGDCNFSGDPNIAGDVWFRYDATCLGNVTFGLCDADYNTKLAIYDTNCPTQALQVLACNDDACGLQSEVTVLAYPGLSLLARIGGFLGARGSGNLEVTMQCIGTTGACCMADGACLDDTSSACASAGGTYEGNGTSCSSFECPQPEPTGACCAGDGSCSVATAGDCAAAGGTYQGDDAPCTAGLCPLPCPADLDGGGDVGFSDLLLILAEWGPCPGCPEDLDGSGDVGFSDILVLLAQWGPC